MAAARKTRVGAAAAGVVVIAGLVAVVLASRRMPGDRTAAAYSASLDDRILLGMFFALVVVATAFVIWSAWPERDAPEDDAPRSWWRQYVISLVVLLVFVLAGAARDRVREPEDAERVARPPAATDAVEGPNEGEGRLPASGTASVALAIAVVAIAVAAAGRTLAARRADRLDGSSGAEWDGEDRFDEWLGEALPADLSEADIAAEPDARRAVRLAYALLDRRLADGPAARPASATPGEWLAVLVRAGRGRDDLGAAARRLTAQYERARFGGERHPVTDADRLDALDALRTLSTALARPSTSTGGRGS